MEKGKIYFGVKDIKSLTGKTGDKVVAGIAELKDELGKSTKSFSWLEVLLFLSTKINSTAFQGFSLSWFSSEDFKDRISRNRALYEYEIFQWSNKGRADMGQR